MKIIKPKISLIKPQEIVSALSQDETLAEVAKQVEEKTIQMADQAS